MTKTQPFRAEHQLAIAGQNFREIEIRLHNVKANDLDLLQVKIQILDSGKNLLKLKHPKLAKPSKQSNFFARGEDSDKTYCKEITWTHSFRDSDLSSDFSIRCELYQLAGVSEKYPEIEFLKIEE